MKPFIICVTALFIANILLIGLFKSQIKKTGSQIISIEASYSAAHAKHSILYRERQSLARRERIIDYAQNNLGMIQLKPDEIAQGNIIREIKEEVAKNDNIIYCFIDFITPPLSAYEIRK